MTESANIRSALIARIAERFEPEELFQFTEIVGEAAPSLYIRMRRAPKEESRVLVDYFDQLGRLDELVARLNFVRPSFEDWFYLYDQLARERRASLTQVSYRDYGRGPTELPEVNQQALFDITQGYLRDSLGASYLGDLDFFEINDFNSILVRQYRDVISHFEGRPELITSLAWTLRTFLEIRRELPRLARGVPGFQSAAVGFLDPASEADVFGILLFTADVTINPELKGRQFTSLLVTLEPPSKASRTARSIEVPVFVRPLLLQQHAAPSLHLARGTATCWARSRVNSNNPLGPGVLTAGHVVPAGGGIGTPLTFTNGQSGTVLDMAPLTGADAALVSSPEPYTATQSLPIMPLVPPWLDVQFDGVVTHRQTKVVYVEDRYGPGAYASARYRATLYLGQCGAQGDSGALVRELRGNTLSQAVGIYCGAGTNTAGQTEGYAQHMAQAAAQLDLELFE